ncbi:MAG: hypothetical protein ACRC0S_05985 [Fusobacteriaceae bacterium]
MNVNKKEVSLKKGGWNKTIYEKIKELIIEYRIDGENKEKSYVVFDWDNTSIVNDIEEALFIYMLENIEFRIEPELFLQLIKKDIPTDNFNNKFNNSEGKPVNINMIEKDIISDYKYIYNNYEKLKGNCSLEEIKISLEYKDFIVKMKYLYDAIVETFEYEKWYLWISTFFTGLNELEMKKIVEKSNEWSLNNSIHSIELKSPINLSGEAGILTAKFVRGIKLIKEQQDLYRTLTENGIDVYICSASNRIVLEDIAVNKKYEYGISRDNLYGMELKKDKENKILPILDEDNFFPTYGKGKFNTIKKISQKYKGKEPIIVVGDSCGDYEMLANFKDLKLGIIIEGEKSYKLENKLKEEKIKNIYLQRKDKETGEFIEIL